MAILRGSNTVRQEAFGSKGPMEPRMGEILRTGVQDPGGMDESSGAAGGSDVVSGGQASAPASASIASAAARSTPSWLRSP